MKLELLQKIYGNPEYYAEYVTSSIIGNLSINGTVSSEQNHSSIVAFNGELMLGSILDHVKSLMERQQQICNKENDYENDDLISSNHYRPTLDGEMGYEELSARQSLSNIPLKNFFIKQLKSAEKLQTTYNENLLYHKVWPAGVPFDENDPEHMRLMLTTDVTVGVGSILISNININ